MQFYGLNFLYIIFQKKKFISHPPPHLLNTYPQFIFFPFLKLLLFVSFYPFFYTRHSKFPIGSCVETDYGIGILVGWRVEDDCHIIRSLWGRRGPGSASAILNRHSLHRTMPAAVGFRVDTRTKGSGRILGFVHGRYVVSVKRTGGRVDHEVTAVPYTEVQPCRYSPFIPIVESLRDAARYKMQWEDYRSVIMQNVMTVDEQEAHVDRTWRRFSGGFELFLRSFTRAAGEDENFDVEVGRLLAGFIKFLEDLEIGGTGGSEDDGCATRGENDNAAAGGSSSRESNRQNESSKGNKKGDDDDISSNLRERNIEMKSTTLLPEVTATPSMDHNDKDTETGEDASTKPGLWLIDNIFGGFLKKPGGNHEESSGEKMKQQHQHSNEDQFMSESYDRLYGVLKIMTRTVAIARASCRHQTKLRLALTVVHEFLLFVRKVIRVQQKNMSKASIESWVSH